MKIAIVDVLGLTYDGSTLEKRGLGGSESAVILMSKELAKIGFDVTVYNDCTSDDSIPGIYNDVLFRPLKEIENCGYFDIMISSRSLSPFAPPEIKRVLRYSDTLPDFSNIQHRSRYKVLWCHDTFIDGDQFLEAFCIDGRINKVFTLSDFHTIYATTCDHGAKRMFEVLKPYIFQTRNGIVKHKEFVDIKSKDPNLFVYNASYTKGMVPLINKIWPMVKERIPNAKLKVIGGFYRFRSDHGPDEQEKQWNKMVEGLGDTRPEVEFTGVIKQNEIAEILAAASYMIYPSAFPETFGISSLESLYYNTPLLTCRFGALEETAIDQACYKINHSIEANSLYPWIDLDYQSKVFTDMVVQAYNNPYLHQQKMYACNQVKEVCTWDTVALQWKQHFFKSLNEYLPVEEYRKVSKINHRVHEVFGRRFMNKEEIIFPKSYPERTIYIITPTYNSENYIRKCITSVAAQDYTNYEMHIINDCSTDNTDAVITSTLENLFPTNGKCYFEYYGTNEENVGAVCNQFERINPLKDRARSGDIIILLDGDDWLTNDPNIFNKINNLYNEGAEFTYGSCWSIADNIPLIAQPYPLEVKNAKSYRNYKFNWNMPYTHLRTFKYDMWSKFIQNDGIKDVTDDQGKFLKAGGDTAIFYGVLEQADPNKVVCVSDILMEYNDMNPLNDYKINGDEQTKTANKVLSSIKNNTKKENDRVKNILIAIPTAKNIEVDTFKSIYDLEIPDGYKATFQYFYGYDIGQVRNLIADWVVKGFDYLFSVDSDVSFSPDTLKKLLTWDKDIVTGIYRQRLEPEILEIYNLRFQNMSYHELSEPLTQIGACGFGCVLVKKKVLEEVGYPQFVYHSALDHKNTFSEDLDFCSKAMSKGFTAWADRSILVNHHGSRIFKVDTQYKPENTTLNRFIELSNMNLLPENHVKFLNELKEEGVEPKLIYDIGSSVLHWTKAAKQVWPNSIFGLFEAMSEVKPLYDTAGINAFYYLGVLTDEDNKKISFYQNLENPGGNSYYKENSKFSTYADVLYPESNKVDKIGTTLDTVVLNFDDQYRHPDLVKIDVQGAEMDVLKGAKSVLETCKHLIIEAQNVEYNIGAPSAVEVQSFIESLGFKLIKKIHDSGPDCDYYYRKDS